MRQICIGLGLASILAIPLSAGQQRDDFAKGFTVEPDEARPMFELALPEDVYKTVTRPDLGDMRVFNRDGTIVPHVVRRRGGSRLELGQPITPQSLAFYPLVVHERDSGSSSTLRLNTDALGNVVGITADRRVGADDERVSAYIVDLGERSVMPSALHLDWKGAGDEGFAVTVTVESSDDLSRWRALVNAAPLAELRSGGEALVHRVLALPPFGARYLRIKWPESLRALQLTGVVASFPPQTQPPPMDLVMVPGVTVVQPVGFEFDTGGLRPVDQVRVVLEEPNTVAEAVVLSRPGPESEWRRHFTGRFYSLEPAGTSLRNGPVMVSQTTDRYWRLELVTGQPALARPPSLEIGWVPDLLTVVAQGEAPFTVAFGSATVKAADRTTEGVLRDIDEKQRTTLISPARVSAAVTLGGESKLQPPPPPLPWRTWLLWSVLLAGVALLGLMVRRLLSA